MNDISPELEVWLEERSDPKFVSTKIVWPRFPRRRNARA